MSRAAVRVEDVSKVYDVGRHARHDTLRDMISATASKVFRRDGVSKKKRDGELWALRDVSLDVKHGEVLGIIGPNGAGKSTLLKILSRITEPTSGRIEVHGRLGSLLEVGTGFDPELTGRENVFLNGAILGMRRSEIHTRFNEIVEFSEIWDFIDMPVKRYSSGMYMRLAFAVAAHLEPEILIVDEVLAVGDASFQRKCLGKMGSVAQTGRTVLFVSHNMLAVEDLCDRVIRVENGCIIDEGDPRTVVSNYLQESFATDTERVWKDRSEAPGTDEVRLHKIRVRPEHGTPVDEITVRTSFVLEVEYWSLQPGAYFSPVLMLYNDQGIMVFTTSPRFDPEGDKRGDPAGLYRHVCRVPGDLLNDGMYRVAMNINKSGNAVVQEEEILTFDVRDAVEMRHGWHGKWSGAIRPLLDWDTELVEADD